MTEKEIIYEIAKLAKEKDLPVYLVGGYLRDKILRRVSHDLDFVIEGDAVAFAREVASHFSLKTSPVIYRRFGTAMVTWGKVTLEFATCRKESYLPNSRKPIVIPATLKDDLSRRDFTINTLALSLRDEKEIDLFSGREDIKKGVIRTPIDPNKTFFDDPLRMLRAIRFASRFNFTIHPQTCEAIIQNRERLKIVSQERIADEFLRMMSDQRPAAAILLLDQLRLLPLILPEIDHLKKVVAADDRNCKDVFRHTLIVLDRVSHRTKDIATRLAALFHDVGKPITQKYIPGEGWTFHDHPLKGARIWLATAARLRVGSPVKEKVARLIEHHLRLHYLAGAGVSKEGATHRAIAHLIKDCGKDLRSLFIIARADLTGKNQRKVNDILNSLDELAERIKNWKKVQRSAVFKLAIDGNDIMNILKIGPGRRVGEVKAELERLVMEGVLPNRKRDLKKYLALIATEAA